MKCSDINIRDPFVLPFEGTYYLYGTPGQFAWSGAGGFWCYTSKDLKKWSEPIKCFTAPADFWADRNFWAPEVHYYNGKFFMFASFFAEGRNRCTQILAADCPTGPFEVWSEPITPADWMCLDGTFLVENGKPYMVFCHEHLQIGTGTICAIELSADLRKPVGEAVTLFGADEAPWVTYDKSDIVNGKPRIVTDGPFMYKDGDELTMFWASFRNHSYAEGIAVSQSGSVFGPWKQLEEPLFDKDGGHGMLFRDFDGNMIFTLHSPNDNPKERPVFFRITKDENGWHKHEQL